MVNPFVKLHVAVVLAGFTGVFGKLISLAEGPLVWWRLLFTSIMMYGYLRVNKRLPALSFRQSWKMCAVGALLAFNWLFFYGSIKYANVSVALVCFATIGFFTAILEPLIDRKFPSLRELCFSLLAVGGVSLIFHFDTQYRVGIILGLIAASLAALFAIFVRKIGSQHHSETILFYQMIGGFTFISLISPLYLSLFPGVELVPGKMDILYLLVLSSICTIWMFLLQIQALQSISAFTVNLTYNLEPIYSIVLAMVFLGEAKELGPAFFVGLGLICISVLFQSLYVLRQSRVARAGLKATREASAATADGGQAASCSQEE